MQSTVLRTAATNAKTLENTGAVLSVLEQTLVPEFADWCEIHFVYQNRLELVALAHRDPVLAQHVFKLSQALSSKSDAMMGAAAVLRTGTEEYLPVVPETLLAALAGSPEQLEVYQQLGYASSFRLPFQNETETFGVISLVRESGRVFQPSDLPALREFVSRIATILNRLRNQEQFGHKTEAAKRWKRSSQRYQNLIGSIPVSMQILNRDGVTIEVNQAWTDLWGYTLEEFVKQGVTLWTDPQLTETGVLECFERAFAGEIVLGPPTFWDGRRVGQGQPRWIRSRIAPIKDEHNQINEILIVHLELSSSEKDEAIKRLLSLGLQLPDQNNPNEITLSSRERETLNLIAQGNSNKQIARALGISESTAKFHVTSLFNKLGVNSRAQVVTVAVQHKLL
jgi:PAS domain S-box-containing protein